MFRDQVGGREGAVAIALGADLLDGLDVVVLVAPEVHDGLGVVGRRIGGVVLLFRRGRRAGEEDARAVPGEAQRALVADHELFAEAGHVGGDQHGGGRRLALPAVELPFGLFGGGVIAVAEEDHLGLVFVPGQLGVFAFAFGQRDGRIGGAGLDGEDSVLCGVARADRVDHLLAVFGEGELHDVGDGALGGIGQIADDQVGAEFGARSAAGGVAAAPPRPPRPPC